jgi:predicted transcriptional regulator
MESELKCSVKATAKALAGKWKVQIVWYLDLQSRRFAELRNLLPGASQKVLTEHLRRLENAGILRRIVTPSAPPRVEIGCQSCKLCTTGAGNIWGSLRIFPEPTHRNERHSDLEFKAIS